MWCTQRTQKDKHFKAGKADTIAGTQQPCNPEILVAAREIGTHPFHGDKLAAKSTNFQAWFIIDKRVRGAPPVQICAPSTIMRNGKAHPHVNIKRRRGKTPELRGASLIFPTQG